MPNTIFDVRTIDPPNHTQAQISITVGGAVRRTTTFILFAHEIDDLITALAQVRQSMTPAVSTSSSPAPGSQKPN
jgi:hypothetical protein